MLRGTPGSDAQDRLDISFDTFLAGPIRSAGAFVDSNDDAAVEGADRDARLVGGNLVNHVDQI